MTQKSEGGQILIIFTIVMVVLLGFASLAVDVGMIYGDRRYNQSIADTASMAGAGAAAQYLEKNGITWANFSCANSFVTASSTIAFDSARSRAANNLVGNLDNNISDNHGIEVTCRNDPDHFEKYIDVLTKVTSRVPTTFMHFFYGGEAKNTVNAVTRVHPRTAFGFGNAIVSLGEKVDMFACKSDPGIVFTGTSDVKITGGGVFSNSCIDGSGRVTVSTSLGGIEYSLPGGFTTSPGAILTPAPAQSPIKMAIQPLGVPACGSGPVQSVAGGGTISPGNYSQIKLTNGDAPLTLNPGLYCMTGDIEVSGKISGNGVTFYMKKNGNFNTNMTITGTAEVHLNAPTAATVTGGALVGILVYMADGNAGVVSLQGTAGSSFAGAIYGKDASINIGGTTGVNPTYNTQLVGKYVKVDGHAEIDINYLNMEPSTTQPNLDMME